MSRLEKASNIAVIVLALVVIGNNLHDRFGPRKPKAEESLSRSLTGKAFALPASLPVGHHGTVTLFLSKDCHYCSESMDFYHRLAGLASKDSSCDIKLVAVGPEGRERREDIHSYLTGHNLKVDGVDVVTFASAGVSSTPTLVLRDSSQLVRNVWVGALSESRQNEVLARVKSLCRN